MSGSQNSVEWGSAEWAVVTRYLEGYSGCVLGHFRGAICDGPPPWGIMGAEETSP